jgi:ribosomal protein L20
MTPATMLRARTRRVLAALANPRGDRETASAHIRNAIQMLSNLLDFGSLDEEDRKDIRAAIRRLWLALREIERANP